MPFLAQSMMDVSYVVSLSVDGAQDDDAQVGLISYCSSASDVGPEESWG